MTTEPTPADLPSTPESTPTSPASPTPTASTDPGAAETAGPAAATPSSPEPAAAAAPGGGATLPPTPPAPPTPPVPPAPPAPPAATGPTNSFGVAAMVLGIVAVVCAVNGWWLFLLPVAIATGILAIVFGRRGRRLADAGQATNRAQATAGLVMGTTALGLVGLLVVVGGILFAAFGDRWEKDWDRWDRHGGRSDSFAECIEDADRPDEVRDCIVSYPDEASRAGLSLRG